jgi:S-adenosylmethionine hydrolase
MNRPIVLLTDFGTRDTYVGQVKAVIASIAPGADVIDLSHDVEPFAIDEAAWLLETALDFLPDDAIVCAIVDPGVGTARKAIVVRAAGRLLVGPDNGVLSAALSQDAREAAAAGGGPVSCAGIPVAVHELCSPQFRLRATSATFHGRDIFAPAAAYISAGLDYRLLGPPLATMVALPPFCGRPASHGVLEGYVVHIDRFGNLVTTIRSSELFPSFELRLGDVTIDQHVRTFANVGPGKLLCHVDSSGFIAVAVNRGSAAELTGARRGDRVVVCCR